MSKKSYRKEGAISTLKSQTTPKRILIFDTETNHLPDENGIVEFSLKLGAMIYVEMDTEVNIKFRRVIDFYTIDEFIQIFDGLLSNRSKLYVFAHNIGFDVRVLNLPFEFANMGYLSQPPIINQRTFIWSIKSDNGSAVFLDTANFGVISVSQLGDDLGFDKLDINFDTAKLDELLHYCIVDCQVLEKFIIEYLKFINTYQLGSFKVTIASQSLTTYRTRFMNNPPIIHCHEKAIQLERKGYHGGRTECFFIGEISGKDFYYVDVNSMYPYVMSSDNLPVEFLGYTEFVPLDYLGARLSRYYVIADVFIETDKPIYPLVNDHKLIFPVGRFRTILYYDELQNAYSANRIKYAYGCSVYRRGELFRDYVDFFYGRKRHYAETGNKSQRTIAKLFQNSLYGKFGQLQPYRYKIGTTDKDIVWRIPCFNAETGEHTQEIAWFGDIYKEGKVGETTFSFPAIAGAITSKARFVLWKYMETAGLDHVYYVDTDSMIVDQQGYDNIQHLLDEYELGKLKLEKSGNSLVIHGSKDYEFAGESKTKGIPKTAEMIANNRWEYLQFQGFITWLNQGANSIPTGEYRTKERKHAYSKGIISDSGRVYPIEFTDYDNDA